MVKRTLMFIFGLVLLTTAAMLTPTAAPSALAQSTSPSGPAVEIISPSPNDTFEQGRPITVSSRSVDAQGIVRVDLVANGQVVATQPNPQPEPNQALLVSQFWVPQIIGNQVIQVVAYNKAGGAGQSAFVFVQVAGGTPTPVPQPTATPTPVSPYVTVSAVSALRVRTGPGTQYEQVGYLLQGQSADVTGQANLGAGLWWQIRFPTAPNGLGWISGSPDYVTAYYTENVPFVTPPPVPTPAPVPTSPPPAATGIDFQVDRDQIRRGDCVNFYWNVSGVRAVYFQGDGVGGENQTRRECPRDDKTYSLRIERTDGSNDTRYIKIEVTGDGTGFNTSTIPRGTKIDFDNGAQPSKRDNEFRWHFDGDRPVFEKVDDDDDDIKLVPLETGSADEFNRLSKDTCRWYLERQDKRRITINRDLIVCFATDKNRTGKLRFTGGNADELIMQWHVW